MQLPHCAQSLRVCGVRLAARVVFGLFGGFGSERLAQLGNKRAPLAVAAVLYSEDLQIDLDPCIFPRLNVVVILYRLGGTLHERRRR